MKKKKTWNLVKSVNFRFYVWLGYLCPQNKMLLNFAFREDHIFFEYYISYSPMFVDVNKPGLLSSPGGDGGPVAEPGVFLRCLYFVSSTASSVLGSSTR